MTGRPSQHKPSRPAKAPPAKSRSRKLGALLALFLGLGTVAAVGVGGGQWSGRASALPVVQNIAELLDARSPGARLGAALSTKVRKLAQAVGLGDTHPSNTQPRSAKRLIPRRSAGSETALAPDETLDVPGLLAPLAGLAPQLAAADPVTGAPGTGSAPAFSAPIFSVSGGGGGGASATNPATPADVPSPTPSATSSTPVQPELPVQAFVAEPSPSASPSPAVSPTPSASPSPIVVPTPSGSPSPFVIPSPSGSPLPVVEPTPPVAPAVPEPASWMAMILGFGLIGSSLRRRSHDTRGWTGVKA